MAASSKLPTVTYIIPTLNSAKVLINCLQSIHDQRYPKNKIQILVIDGGSTDSTIKISQLYGCKIIYNDLKTAESSKAIGIRQSKSDFIALVDSDNILPDENWLTRMLSPLISNNNIIGSEPWAYTYRPQAGFIERYCSLTGVNDPYSLVAKNYDRQNLLTGKWTGLKLNIDNHQYYQTVILDNNRILPTIGANGTIYRSVIIKKYFKSKYFFDVDFLYKLLSINKSIVFAKVKTSIIHSYCESSTSKFYRKQLRRATDLYLYQHLRTKSLSQHEYITTIKFCLYVTLLVPMFYDTFKGLIKKCDMAWTFHPLACLITLYTYGITTIKYKIGILQPINRLQWQQ